MLETILLVEDDRDLRTLSCDILKRSGYRVLDVSSGAEAVKICQTKELENLHLLLTDVTMPSMSGPKLMKRVRELRPDIKVLFMSGFIQRRLWDDDESLGLAYIAKPFTIQDFTRKVREVLDTTI